MQTTETVWIGLAVLTQCTLKIVPGKILYGNHKK